MKPKLIITGASGFLGTTLLAEAVKTHEVFGLYHQQHFIHPSASALKCDITDYIALGNLIDDIEPDAIIHLAALTDTNYCQQNPQESLRVNVEASTNLAGICADYNIPLLFSSTDLVFDGTKGMYTEEDEANPLNLYGEHKALAEQKILDIYPLATICRLPLMFSVPNGNKPNYLSNVIQQIKNQQPVSLFSDEYRSIAGMQSISIGLLQLLDKTNGIYHLAGSERLSRFEFGLLICDAFNLDKNLLHSCSQQDVALAAPRPADVSLNISKAQAVGYMPLLVVDELKALQI
jgi:dTDP-4-dehydrorhamnose reductase